MIYVVACAGADQLAGIVPSSVPPGAGTLTVTCNGQSGSAPIQVVDRTPGFFTINQGGTGAAIIQNYNSATDLVINTLATPAKPGQYAIAWGTGLGPDGHSDVDAPQPTDLPVNLELYVGGKLAALTYKGRSGCCAGIDQIVFQVPAGLDGCYVPVVAKIGNAVSNFTTMSVSASGGACSDAGGLSASDIQLAQRNNRIRLGMVGLFRADIELVTGANTGNISRYDQASAVFTDLSFGELLGMPVREVSTPGSCTVWRGSGEDAILDRPPVLGPHMNLDAGSITVQGCARGVRRDELSGRLRLHIVGQRFVGGAAGGSGTEQRLSGAWLVCGLFGRGRSNPRGQGDRRVQRSDGGHGAAQFRQPVRSRHGAAGPGGDGDMVRRGCGRGGRNSRSLGSERSGNAGCHVLLRGKGERRAVHRSAERSAEPSGGGQFDDGEWERAGPECGSDWGGALQCARRGCELAALPVGVRPECDLFNKSSKRRH